MTKETFIKLMTGLIELKESEEKLDEAFRAFAPDFNGLHLEKYEALVLMAIKASFKHPYDWIEYWLYDLNCGKDYKKNYVTDKKGKNVPLKTLSDLYNLIK